MRLFIAALAIVAACVPAAAIAQTSHEGWPRINGELWINKTDRSTSHHGGARNDELLGGHGDDRIYGHGGSDVIWGDYKPTGNTSAQVDRVRAGAGNDWVYGSHGWNTIYAGPGNDTVRVWFGRGYVNCGPGRDILYVSHASGKHVKRRNCETISHKSARDAG
jgi:hypothetical protein